MDKYILQKLRDDVESFFATPMQTRRDFDRLALAVTERTGESVSPTTLRRFWGYQEQEGGYTVSTHTITMLCRLVGARSLEEYEARIRQDATADADGAGKPASENSAFINGDEVLETDMLIFGDRIVLSWAPNRRVEVEYQGREVFRVISSENSKLRPADTFHTRQFVNGEPLYCRSLVRCGVATSDYYCGKQGGIHFTKKQSPSP